MIFYDGDLVIKNPDGSYRHIRSGEVGWREPLPKDARVYWRGILLNPHETLNMKVEDNDR